MPTIMRRIAWLFYIVGTTIVFGSYIFWTGIYAWVGWIIGMIGWGMMVYARPRSDRSTSPSSEVSQDGPPRT